MYICMYKIFKNVVGYLKLIKLVEKIFNLSKLTFKAKNYIFLRKF